MNRESKGSSNTKPHSLFPLVAIISRSVIRNIRTWSARYTEESYTLLRLFPTFPRVIVQSSQRNGSLQSLFLHAFVWGTLEVAHASLRLLEPLVSDSPPPSPEHLPSPISATTTKYLRRLHMVQSHTAPALSTIVEHL